MKSARLYNCVRCHCLVVICSPCDRGNIYCKNGCAKLARKEMQRKSSQRYQNTRRGKLKHAARQKSYMLRIQQKTQIMTHHGSHGENNNVKSDQRLTPAANAGTSSEIHCNFCRRLCSDFIRNDFLRSNSVVTAECWPLGP